MRKPEVPNKNVFNNRGPSRRWARTKRAHTCMFDGEEGCAACAKDLTCEELYPGETHSDIGMWPLSRRHTG
jgi:hypothetical protein